MTVFASATVTIGKIQDGQTLYMWVKYADTPTTGMSDSPDGKSYIGIAYNKPTKNASTSYSDYQWMKVN